MLGTNPQPILMQFLSALASRGYISENILEINHKKLHSNEEKPYKHELIKCERPTKTVLKSPCVLLMQSNGLIELASSSIPLNTILIAFAVEICEGIYTETS